jgi:hypothetical protein
MFQGKVELLVPSLIREEFERNRPRAEAAVTANVRERFRLLRKDLQEYGGDAGHRWLDEMTHQVPFVSAMTLQNFAEISELLRAARSLEPTDVEHARVVQRGLEKRAPFHLEKNSVADALLIELYSTAINNSSGTAEDQYCFVTSNYSDFSLPHGDRHQPHPDVAALFAEERSRYIYEVNGLNAVLMDNFGKEFTELSEEAELVREEPRTLAEILEAEREHFDKVWYVRQLILQEKIEMGKIAPMPPHLVDRAQVSMRAIEERYGPQNVGPLDDWGWGFVHGKLSALRWVLGSEWDFLDT